MGGIALLVLAALGAAAACRSSRQGSWRGSPTPGPAPAAAGWNWVNVPRRPGGHCYLEAQVHGEEIRFLVDTGASAVVLNPEDARRIGLGPERLHFSERFRTANGLVRVAPVIFCELRIGQLAMPNLPAVVDEAPIGVLLHGTSFLARLAAWRVEGGRLHLE